MGSKTGALAVAARRTGCDLATYTARISAGLKWCTLCREWQPRAEFGEDASRGDGLTSVCIRSRSVVSRARYKPKPKPKKGRAYVPARDGDKEQARRRVNYLVSAGLLPAPNTLPCVDCAHEHAEGERRHEYDHFRGYAAQHHEHVEAVCTTCHHTREANRGLDN